MSRLHAVNAAGNPKHRERLTPALLSVEPTGARSLIIAHRQFAMEGPGLVEAALDSHIPPLERSEQAGAYLITLLHMCKYSSPVLIHPDADRITSDT